MKTFLEYTNTPRDYHHVHYKLQLEDYPPNVASAWLLANDINSPATDTNLFSPLLSGDVTILRTKDKILNELNYHAPDLPFHGWVTGFHTEGKKLYAKLHSPKMEELHHSLLKEYDTSHFDPYFPLQEQYAPFLLMNDRWMASLPEVKAPIRLTFNKKLVEPIYEDVPNYTTISW